MAIQSVLSEHVVQHTVTAAEAAANLADISVGPIANIARQIIVIKESTGGVLTLGATVTLPSVGTVRVADTGAVFDLAENDVITLLFVE